MTLSMGCLPPRSGSIKTPGLAESSGCEMDQGELKQMVQDCLKRLRFLNEWEHNFVRDMNFCLGTGLDLSRPQAETLEKIWNKATERG